MTAAEDYNFQELMEEREFRKCAPDTKDPEKLLKAFIYFCENFWSIRHPERGRIQFEMFEAQIETVESWLSTRYSLILKARQIGFSTLVATYCFWNAAFYPDRPILMLSRTEREAIKLLQKSKYGRQFLPEWMQFRMGPYNATQTKMEFANGSYIESLPSASDPARGESAYLVVVDELAFLQNSEEAWGAIEPVADVGGRVIMLSTANGEGNLFHRLWVGATTGANRFTPLFFPWSANGRQPDWYEAKARDTPDWLMAQEYPCIAAGERVGTSAGIVPIESVSEGVLTTSGKVLTHIPKGKRQIVEVVTSHGTVLRCTPDHLLAQPDGSWVPAAEATEIVLSRPTFAESPHFAELRSFPSVESRLEITPDMGRWLGLFMGDGSCSCTTISFVSDAKDADVMDEWERLCEELWGVTPARRVVGSKGGGVEQRFTNKQLSLLLDDLGCTKVSGRSNQRIRKVCVPEAIWLSPEPVVREFIRGLFESDGFSAKDQNTVKLFTKWTAFMRDVKVLLLGLGLHGRIKAENKTRDNRTYFGQSMTLGGPEAIKFHEEVGFIGQRRRSRRGSSRGSYARFERLVEQVVSVTPVGEAEVYDLEIEGEHRFDASGVVVHNCNPEDAFLRSGRPVFNLNRLREIETSKPTRGYLDPSLKFIEDGGALRIWTGPTDNGKYVIGADPSQGMEHGDYASVHVINARNYEVVAHWHGLIDPDLLATEVLDRLGRWYNNALIGVESNNHGLTTLKFLHKNCRYNPIYTERSPKYKKSVPTDTLGFRTTQITKPLMIDELNEALRGAMTLQCVETLAELRTFTRNEKGKMAGSPHDDRTISLAIANQMLKYVWLEQYSVKDTPPPGSFGAWEKQLYGSSMSDVLESRKQNAPRKPIGAFAVRGK